MIFKGKQVLIDIRYEYLLKDYSLSYLSQGYLIFTDTRKNGEYKNKRLHRVIYELEYGIIEEGCVIHHKNTDRLDNRIWNFVLMKRSEHTREHDLVNNPFKGRKHSNDMKKKLSVMRKGVNNPFYGKKHSSYSKECMSNSTKDFYLRKVNNEKI